MKTFATALLLLLAGTALRAQPAAPGALPKREFRGAWVATVSNIDWPSRPGLPVERQQAEALARLDALRALGCNAVILQVRPAADAFYESPYEPWSRFLTGRQGTAPQPYWDPLRFWCEEAHRRGMELHAWFNPFRALTDSKKNPNPPSHVTRQHPDWVLHYGGKSYLDPGNPAAREYVVRVITDCARRYDVDAVHLDDYFYPYKVPGHEFPDEASYRRWGDAAAAPSDALRAGSAGYDAPPAVPNKGDWRRANVSRFIQALHDSVRAAKPWVKIGVSPFGVWRSRAKDSLRGSDTRPTTTTNYDDLYADVLLWQERGWTDYLLPQLYWERGHRSAPFEVLMPWWNFWRYGRHVYYGLGVYRMAEAKRVAPWHMPDELLAQIRAIRALHAPTGYAFYSTASFDKISPALTDSLRRTYTPTLALPPVMPWLDSIAPPAPSGLRVVSLPDGASLSWTAPRTAAAEPLRYAVYRFAEGEYPDISRAERLAALTSEPRWTDPTAPRSTRVFYVVTALDRLWNESPPTPAALRP